jgi:hypothetical protein
MIALQRLLDFLFEGYQNSVEHFKMFHYALMLELLANS